MNLYSNIQRWLNVAHFSLARLPDYANLAAAEFELAKKRLVRDIILYAVVALSIMFALGFICCAIIVSASNTAYYVQIAWAVASFWVLLSLATFWATHKSDNAGNLSVLTEELQLDIQTIKESLQ